MKAEGTQGSYIVFVIHQAVYAAFAGAFPDLNEVVDEDFMNELVATCFEWISGIHPPPDVWKNWKLNMLNPNFDMGIHQPWKFGEKSGLQNGV